MNSEHRNFVETFRKIAEPVLARHPELGFVWESHPKGGGYTLRVLKTANSGFDAGVEVQTYGLYPFAGEWHGSPWDITTPDTTVVAMCRSALGLVRALLSSDMRLRVRSAGGRPYKWCIEVASPSGWRLHEETAFLFFRFWSTRSEECFQNEQLPPLGFADGSASLHPFEMIWA